MIKVLPQDLGSVRSAVIGIDLRTDAAEEKLVELQAALYRLGDRVVALTQRVNELERATRKRRWWRS